ncbi:MAG TPA: ATP-binding protein [bacterium]|nr:ATP-binding protein [bacterium]
MLVRGAEAMNRSLLGTLRGRVTLYFAGLAVILLAVPGWFFYRTATDYLVRELAVRLMLGARLTASQFEAETVAQLRAGDERKQLYAVQQSRLARARQALGATEVRLLDPQRRALVSVDQTPIGAALPFIGQDVREIDAAVRTGEPQVSHLYSDGQNYYMTAYAPLCTADGRTVALLRLEGSPLISDFLAAYRDQILLVAALGLALILLFSRVLSRQVLEPVRALAAGVRRLSAREYTPVPVTARDELGFLAEEFNRMAETLRRHEQELTELHRLEAMRASKYEAYTQHILENIRSGIIACQLDGTLTLANRRSRELLNLPDEVTGRPYAQVLSAYPPFLTLLEATIAQRVGQAGHDVAVASGDGRRHFDFVTSLLCDGAGQVLGVIAMIIETTRLRELQEEVERAERLAAVGQLAAGVAHEVRNPLSGISGFVELLQRKVTDNDAALRLTEKIQQEIRHLNGIVTDFLSFARPQPLQRLTVAAGELVQGAVALVEPHAAARGVLLAAPAGHEVRLLADGEQVRQVLVNLLRNAVEASAAGQTVVATWAEEGMFIAFSVADTGRGMAMAERKTMFNPFFTTKDDGTGLGLTICHAIVERHGGHIRVESEPGRGTNVTVLLPTGGV